ncbi:MAG: PQQ-binding-like beta-propeller repeat protein [Planctomycetota bacterium]
MRSMACALVVFFSCGVLQADTGTELIQASGIPGGLVVHIGCGDGQTTGELRVNEHYLVHGLDQDPANVAAARQSIGELGCYGQVTISSFDGSRLPYMDRLVSLLVVLKPGCSVPADEIDRVLAPRGKVIARRSGNERLVDSIGYRSVDVGNGLVKLSKPVPREIDDWPHYFHGPDNNAVSQDMLVAPPRRLQWECGPRWSRSHETDMSMSGAVALGGRIFYFIDEGPIGIHETPEEKRRLPDKFSLVCRDAFNGMELWRRPVSGWGSKAWDDDRLKPWGPRDQLWSSPLTLPRRLVAADGSVYVTLGYRTFVTELDAETGETVREFGELGTVDEILAVDGKLVLRARKGPAKEGGAGPETLTVVETESGDVLWDKQVAPLKDLTLAVANGIVCFCSARDVVALELETGDELWRSPVRQMKLATPTLVMHDEVVIFAGRGSARAFSATDGDQLWERKTGRGSFRGPMDVFVADGLAWMGTLSSRGLDPKTGEVVRNIDAENLFTPGHHSRCYRARATENHLLWSKRGVEFLDLDGTQHSRNDWVRGTCRYGIIPANGLLYAPPTPCFCYPGVKINGFNALAPAAAREAPDIERLHEGPAYGRVGTGRSSPSDWPTYRHENARGGATSADVPTTLERAWKTRIGASLTPPVLVDGRLFVANKETHTVHCLNAATGDQLWCYVAGGRVDSPPTVRGDCVLFGCADGQVYCLEAESGTLVWRFHAAPRDQRVVSHGQLESSWPVHGNVLVKNDVAYVAAGRSSFLDGGVYLYGLDIATGAVECQNHMDGPWTDPHEPSPHGAHWMDGGRTDLLVCEDDKLYMLQNVFDLQLNQLEAPVIAKHGAREMDRHLSAMGGFLDTTGFDRLYWMHAARWPGLYFAYNAPKTGQILVFDEQTTYALHTFAELFSRSPYFSPGTSGHELVADDNDNEPYLDPAAAKRERQPGYSRQKPPMWRVKIPVRARAMVLAGKTLFLAGPPDKVDPDDPLAAFEGRTGSLLRAVSTSDGATLAEYPLDAQPVFDSLIAVPNKLYMCMKDGTVRCWKGKE